MSRADVAAWVQQAYAVRLLNDATKAADLFVPDASFQLAGADGPGRVATRANSRQDIHALLNTLVSAWEWHSMDELSLVIEGNRAAVHYRLRQRFMPTNKVVETEIFDLITFKDGKIVDMVEFCDTALATDLITEAMAVGGTSPAG